MTSRVSSAGLISAAAAPVASRSGEDPATIVSLWMDCASPMSGCRDASSADADGVTFSFVFADVSLGASAPSGKSTSMLDPSSFAILFC